MEKLEFRWAPDFSGRQAGWSLADSAELGLLQETAASSWMELGTLSALPSLSQFRRLGGWEGRAVRNCGLFLIRDHIWPRCQFGL